MPNNINIAECQKSQFFKTFSLKLDLGWGQWWSCLTYCSGQSTGTTKRDPSEKTGEAQSGTEKISLQLYIPYSRKIWWGIKFGGLAVYITITKSKNFLLHSHIILYVWRSRTEPPSANILAMAILGSTTKFNSCQYFRLYGTFFDLNVIPNNTGSDCGN